MIPAIVLASASPRRKEILGRLGIPFTVLVSEGPEPFFEGNELPCDFVTRCAGAKLINVLNRHDIPDDTLVLAFDTVVALEDRIFGKPSDYGDACEMLKSLSGRTHSVFTGFAFAYRGKNLTGFEETKVTFRELSDEEITNYINSEQPYDKAGSYAIQEGAGAFVSLLEGDYDNVVGLPLERALRELKSRFGISLGSL